MDTFYIEEVKTRQHEADFLNLPLKIYKDDPNWVRPLDVEMKQIFDPSANKMFRHGRLCRWVMYNGKREVVGRIAAFIDDRTAILNDQLTGGMGFFECIDNQQAANMLFDTGKKWLIDYGMAAADAPVNFGSRDQWWGLLVDGFTPASYAMNYNPPYYQALFENYGFKNYFNQYSYLSRVGVENVAPVMIEKANRIFENPEYKITFINKKDFNRVIPHFCKVYNAAWTGHSGVATEMTEEKVHEMLKTLKPIMDERLILFAYHNDEPIGFFVQIPELNQVIRHLNGKFSLYHKLKMLYLLKFTKTCTRVMGLVFGIIPEYRARGVEGALVMKFAEKVFAKGFPYKDVERTWVGDFNPVMMRFQEQIGGKVYKTHITYRLLFDPDKQANEFQRAPRMGRERKQPKD